MCSNFPYSRRIKQKDVGWNRGSQVVQEPGISTRGAVTIPKPEGQGKEVIRIQTTSKKGKVMLRDPDIPRRPDRKELGNKFTTCLFLLLSFVLLRLLSVKSKWKPEDVGSLQISLVIRVRERDGENEERFQGQIENI